MGMVLAAILEKLGRPDIREDVNYGCAAVVDILKQS